VAGNQLIGKKGVIPAASATAASATDATIKMQTMLSLAFSAVSVVYFI